MDTITSFGYWVRRRRKALDLTQRALADRVGCSVVTVKKIEADVRQPSQHLAERLADMLAVPPEERAAFLARARGILVSNQRVEVSEPKMSRAIATIAALPVEHTQFLGRASELRQLATLLANPACRLLTLVGPGGIGKTRLMLRVAAQLQEDRDVCFVPLADITHAPHVASAIVQCLGVQHIGDQLPQHALIAFLRNREVMLLLDTVEHLLADDHTRPDGLLHLVSQILALCPQVTLLVTSRERLQLQAEWVFPVTGLLVEEARALFVARAQQVDSTFSVATQQTIIDDICRLVEGMPVAIELAASWTPLLSCAQIQQQLEHDLDQLSSRLRDLPRRHHSLRAVFDQSWNLLTNDQRELFARLWVFRGGFSVEMMEAVCGSQKQMLLALVDKSLVRSTGTGCYSLHEVARRYAADQCTQIGATATVQQAHCEAYLLLAETAATHFAGPTAFEWFERLDQEQDNLRAALDWALQQFDTLVLYRFVQPLTRYWYARGRWQEGIASLQAIVERTANSLAPQRAIALCWCGMMLVRSGRATEATGLFQAGYTLAHQTEDAFALGLASLVTTLIDRAGDAPQRHYQTAMGLFRQAHDDEMLAMTLYFWGDDQRMHDAIGAARAAYTESLQLYRHMGNLMYLAYPLGNLGRIALLEGDIGFAHRSFAECVAYSRRNGNHISLVDWLTRLGSVELYGGNLSLARTLFQEAYSLASDCAYQFIMPEIHAWLALTEALAGNYQQAMEFLNQSVNGYAMSGISLNNEWNASRPEVIHPLIASTYVHMAQMQCEQVIVLVSGIDHLIRSSGYRLDHPLQKIIDTMHSTCQKALGAMTYQALWEQGQAMTVNELLVFAASFNTLS